MELDLGDVTLSLRLLVKGQKRFGLRLRVGVPSPTTPEDRVVRGRSIPSTGRPGTAMDLAADQQVPLSVQYTDEVGNPTDAPEGASVVYSVDDTSLINLTDNGDGTAVAAAVGALGAANVHVEANVAGQVLTGDLQIVVVAGLAERLDVVAGPPTEVTPD